MSGKQILGGEIEEMVAPTVQKKNANEIGKYCMTSDKSEPQLHQKLWLKFICSFL